MRLAAIDLGTNQFHLLIAEQNPDGKLNILLKEDRFVRIGEGGINESLIMPEAMERAISAMRDFKTLIEQYHCQKVGAVATSAVRNAKNGTTLINRIAELTGIHVEIIDGEKEAVLIYEGIRHTINIAQISLVADIGGGSVEFIICDAAKIYWKASFEIGAQRLFYSFHTIDPIPAENVVALNHYLSHILQPLSDAVAHYKPANIIGSSGSFSTLYKLYAGMEGIVYEKGLPQYELPVEGYYKVHKQLLLKNRNERAEMPGMRPERKDMIVTASCIIYFLIRLLNPEKITVVSASLREGLLASLIDK
ncbi:MAG: exopolyphosphatase [Cytophagales bacterium]|nr:exopolyphosphatase [Bernardetiaceae bacterium]MDW8203878.1 exopolyphosphatase [Cytophagales bacterium]